MGLLSDAVLGSTTFQASFHRILRQSILSDLKAISPGETAAPVEWSHALLMASALQADESDAGQDVALRIVQACLTDPESHDTHREAAIVLLERMGNDPAVRLAERRDLVEQDAWSHAPVALQVDVLRRRLELSIPLSDGTSLRVNSFQRSFWDAAMDSDWVSASAPTSSGKSFIVRRLIGERLKNSEAFTAIYLVPTRALIEEVTSELRDDLAGRVAVYALPWDSEIEDASKRIVVFTQERLHLLHDRLPEFKADVVFVDEAQKFSDGERGVLLQRVIDEAVARNSKAKVIYASPLADNPELLLDGAPQGVEGTAILSTMSTVNQNLLWVNAIPYKPTEWSVELLEAGEPLSLGTITLPGRPTNQSKRLSLVALALGKDLPGNVVYVNGPADAERIALQIFDGLSENTRRSRATEDLRELIGATIHPDYALAQVLTRGVAFHYGNMPLLIRSEIERLFRLGEITYLVCTSTLLEGVNLPCRNLFVRGPRRGRTTPMEPFDFWNLAGRAGRWGKEFQGNIVCIDTANRDQWPDPPRIRQRRPISRAVRRATTSVEDLIEYIAVDDPAREDRDAVFDAIFSLLAARILRHGDLAGTTWLSLVPSNRHALEEAISARLEDLTVGVELIVRHAGISPVGMQAMLTEFQEREDLTELLVEYPESHDAARSYVRALARCDRFLGSRFGQSAGRHYQMAILIRDWMRGHSMARIISERVRHFRTADPGRAIARIIRESMTDIEQVARFQAPKYLSCYVDLLKLALEGRDEEELSALLPDLAMMLELGVSRQTELSLMAIGLSRATAIAVGDYIVEDDLSPAACRRWLASRALQSLGLPALMVREVQETLALPA